MNVRPSLTLEDLMQAQSTKVELHFVCVCLAYCASGTLVGYILPKIIKMGVVCKEHLLQH